MFTRINQRGFTLVELLVVVVIIAVLAAIAVPIFLNQKQKAQESATMAGVVSMAGSLDIGKSTGGSANITSGRLNVLDGTGVWIIVPIPDTAVITIDGSVPPDSPSTDLTNKGFCVSMPDPGHPGAYTKMTDLDTKPVDDVATSC